jgi:hypothetical protein
MGHKNGRSKDVKGSSREYACFHLGALFPPDWSPVQSQKVADLCRLFLDAPSIEGMFLLNDALPSVGTYSELLDMDDIGIEGLPGLYFDVVMVTEFDSGCFICRRLGRDLRPSTSATSSRKAS